MMMESSYKKVYLTILENRTANLRSDEIRTSSKILNITEEKVNLKDLRQLKSTIGFINLEMELPIAMRKLSKAKRIHQS